MYKYQIYYLSKDQTYNSYNSDVNIKMNVILNQNEPVDLYRDNRNNNHNNYINILRNYNNDDIDPVENFERILREMNINTNESNDSNDSSKQTSKQKNVYVRLSKNQLIDRMSLDKKIKFLLTEENLSNCTMSFQQISSELSFRYINILTEKINKTLCDLLEHPDSKIIDNILKTRRYKQKRFCHIMKGRLSRDGYDYVLRLYILLNLRYYYSCTKVTEFKFCPLEYEEL